jgi:threonine/homoserine/homoserine lactone efflux protein
MIGLVLNIIPGLISQTLAKKVVSKEKKVFVASIILSSGVGFYTVYYLLVILILSFIFGWKAFAFLLAWPLGFVYLFWKNNYRSSIARAKYHLTDEEQRQIKSLLSKYSINLNNIEV